MVVDLAVENQPRTIVAAVHWLMSGGGEVDDREAAKAETAATVVEDQIACVVWAAMSHLIAHACDQRRLNRALTRAVFPDSADSAHILFRIANCELRIADCRSKGFAFRIPHSAFQNQIKLSIFQLSLPGRPEIRQHAEIASLISP